MPYNMERSREALFAMQRVVLDSLPPVSNKVKNFFEIQRLALHFAQALIVYVKEAEEHGYTAAQLLCPPEAQGDLPVSDQDTDTRLDAYHCILRELSEFSLYPPEMRDTIHAARLLLLQHNGYDRFELVEGHYLHATDSTQTGPMESGCRTYSFMQPEIECLLAEEIAVIHRQSQTLNWAKVDMAEELKKRGMRQLLMEYRDEKKGPQDLKIAFDGLCRMYAHGRAIADHHPFDTANFTPSATEYRAFLDLCDRLFYKNQPDRFAPAREEFAGALELALARETIQPSERPARLR